MIARADAFPIDDFTADETTADETTSAGRRAFPVESTIAEPEPEPEPEPLPPAPHHLVGIDRQPWRFPWLLLLSFVTTMAALVVAHGL